MTFSAAELARYDRQLRLPEFALPGQERLKAARVLIVGAGGLGSPAASYLAAAGVGTVTIADGDRVDESNLHRQLLFATSDIGAKKADAARARLQALNPQIAIVALAHRLDASNLLAAVRAVDVVVDGSDRIATRYLLNDACVLEGRPLVSAAVHRFEGQSMVYVPHIGPCYRCLFPDASDGIAPNCAEAGVLGVLPGVLGTIQATETLKLILGIGAPLVGRLLTYDALAMRFQEFAFKRRDDCAVCGKQPTIHSLSANAPISMSAIDLAQRLRHRAIAGLSLSLIDVREPGEFSIGHLPSAINIPLGKLSEQFDRIPANTLPVFICRSGARSLRACALVAQHGATPCGHLDGGLLSWIATVDSSLKVDQ